KWLADRAGKATGILLARHGAIVTGATIEDACYRAVTFERMCRFTYDVLQAGRMPVEIAPPERSALKAALLQNAPRVYWEGAVRQLLAREPEALE
ncbi:MAG TPA: class II aldolase/adducin family protein, partial [Acidimicrobiia bacterium]|nr:class II aldolase/adducin family protein [Acidimicrobiia bacterium]